MCEDRFLSSHVDLICRVRNKVMYVLLWRTVYYMHSVECYFGVYFPCCFAAREINSKITFSTTHIVSSIYVSLYFIACIVVPGHRVHLGQHQVNGLTRNIIKSIFMMVNASVTSHSRARCGLFPSCFEQKSHVHSRGPYGPRATPYEFCIPVRARRVLMHAS